MMFPVGGYKCMIPCNDSVSAIESSARLVFGWLATARHSKTSRGDGGFVYCKRGHRWRELFKLEEFGERWSPLLKMVHSMESCIYFIFMVSREALGNKSGSFCEAVNCERSEQEEMFLFAMLVSCVGFKVIGSRR